jgi:hypothetical protein
MKQSLDEAETRLTAISDKFESSDVDALRPHLAVAHDPIPCELEPSNTELGDSHI